MDNEGAKFSLIKGYMDSKTGDPMIQAISRLEYEQNAWNWTTRVPSPSNPSDDVSRLDTTWALSNGYTQVHPVQPKSFIVDHGHVVVQ